MTTASKTPITCHVLDTVTGLPATSIPVTLTLLRPYGPSNPLTALTNSDGRVTAWNDVTDGPTLQEIFDNARRHVSSSSATQGARMSTAERTGEVDVGGDVGGGDKGSLSLGEGEMVWALRFDVGFYFKGEGFWEVVEVRFKTVVKEEGGEGEEGRSHWHVPLLLSPWSYTTYRGS